MGKLSLPEQTAMLFNCWRSINRLYDQYAKSIGMTYLGLSVLDAIYETPEGCTQKVICEKTYMPKQSVNAVIRSLWEQGYIEMKEIDADRRNKEIRLTMTGREYADRTVGRLIRAEESTIADFSYEQRQEMIELVTLAESRLMQFVQNGREKDEIG